MLEFRHIDPPAFCMRSTGGYLRLVKALLRRCVVSLKPSWPRAAVLLLTLALSLAGSCAVCAQATTANRPWAYLLLHDSYLLDDCPICDRLSRPVPMRGTFNLRLIGENPVSSRYALENIQFTASDRPYRVTGSGTFEIAGEVAVTLQMSLQVQIDDGFTNQVGYLTNATVTVDRPWPMIDITLGQTNGTPTQVFTLRLAAAPVRDLWFSTVGGFTPAAGQTPLNYVEGGDLLSTSGRVVKHNADLFTSVGAFPPVPDLGLDAVDILPGGEVAFSLASGIFSTTLGPLQHGDLLSTQGRIIRRNQDLLAAFMTEPATNDVGLDAVHVLDGGDILFSIATNVFSKQLNATLHRGDLLSSAGTILRSNQQLLARFHPTNATNDYGLDALYIWPSGEIWFSTEDGFQDQVLGAVLAGDLLSDQGYIVFRNLELLSTFAPKETPMDFGLDALYVVTDATPLAQAPQLTIQGNRSTGTAHLIWQGQGRVFQVGRADHVTGPFQPLSPILPDLLFDDVGTLTNRSQAWYRISQW